MGKVKPGAAVGCWVRGGCGRVGGFNRPGLENASFDPAEIEAAVAADGGLAIGVQIEERSQIESPSFELLVAVCQDAFECLVRDEFRRNGTLDHGARREKIRARKWFDGTTPSEPQCSFAEICEQAEVDPDWLRTAVYERAARIEQDRLAEQRARTEKKAQPETRRAVREKPRTARATRTVKKSVSAKSKRASSRRASAASAKPPRQRPKTASKAPRQPRRAAGGSAQPGRSRRSKKAGRGGRRKRP